MGNWEWGIGNGELALIIKYSPLLPVPPLPPLLPVPPLLPAPCPFPTPLHLLLDPRVPVPKEFDFLHGVPVTLSSFASAIDLPDW